MLFASPPLEGDVGSDWSLEHGFEWRQGRDDQWQLPRNFKQSGASNSMHARVQIIYHRCQY